MVFIDSNIGDLSGVDFAAKLRSDPRTATSRLILMEGSSAPLEHARRIELKIIDTLQKPLKPLDLKEVITRTLARKTGASAESNLLSVETNPVPPPAPLQVPPTLNGDGEIRTRDLAPASSVRPLKLLLVEDSEVNREVALIQLQAWNHETTTAENGRIAVDILSEQYFDGVLMDCQMPEMDGYEATTEIRRPDSSVRDHGTYIIAMTANALQGDRDKCIDVGMNDYVSKPVNEVELINALQRCAVYSSPEAAEKPMQRVTTRTTSPTQEFPPHLIELFLNETDRRLIELAAALQKSAGPEAARIAHNIKGTAGNFKSTRLAELTKDIEAACIHNDLTQAESLISEARCAFEIHKESLLAAN
jgi:CheY-like chemotaxis protein